MTEIEAKLADLINFSSSQKPLEFEGSFRDIMNDKVYSAIADKKIEIAKRMFASSVDTEEEEVDGEAA